MTTLHPALQNGPIYLDYNATTPVDLHVLDAMDPYLRTHFGNPSSAHHYGTEPQRALNQARSQVAALIGGSADEITFTGSGSEADILAIRGAALAQRPDSAHVIVQETEHPAVLATCESLQRLHHVDVTYLPVDRNGTVDPETLADAITARTTLVSIMFANNETGTLQPIRELASIAHGHGALFHTDAAQAVAKVNVDVRHLGVDMLTIVGHKMYAPKGIAALWTRAGVTLEPITYGGGQEHGLRAGTENIALSVALGAAASLAGQYLADGESDRQRRLRDELHRRLADALPGRVTVNGHPSERLPNVANLSIDGVDGNQLLAQVPDVAASTGSACHGDISEPSPVLLSMSGDAAVATSAIRFSTGRWTTEDDIIRTVDRIVDTVEMPLDLTAS